MNPAPFTQVAVWPGVIVGPSQIEGFVAFCADAFDGTRVQYIREVYTNPDVNEFGRNEPGTGGRCDVLFGVHEDDIGKFAVPRLHYGMRWLDDVYGNGGGYLYPDSVRELLCWSATTQPDTVSEDDIFERPSIDDLLNS
jgi:hypothetical protein